MGNSKDSFPKVTTERRSFVRVGRICFLFLAFCLGVLLLDLLLDLCQVAHFVSTLAFTAVCLKASLTLYLMRWSKEKESGWSLMCIHLYLSIYFSNLWKNCVVFCLFICKLRHIYWEVEKGQIFDLSNLSLESRHELWLLSFLLEIVWLV